MGSKYPNTLYLPKTTITTPVETLHTLHLGTVLWSLGDIASLQAKLWDGYT